jgi:hypothetical protein
MRRLMVLVVAACGPSSGGGHPPDAGAPRPDAPSGAPDAPLAVPDAPLAVPDAQPMTPDAGPVTLIKARTEHLGKLIGTSRTPLQPIGLIGTDLGTSFERDGELFFLFGDSWTTPADTAYWNDDSIAWSSPTLPADGQPPPLFWFLDPSSPRFLTLGIPGVDLGGMNVPVEGVPIGAATYVFASSGYDAATNTHSTSALAHTTGQDFGGLVLDHAVASTKFINVSVVSDGGFLWIFGSGPYRASPVYLARVDLATIADRSSWVYWDGAGYSPGESSAVPVVDVTCVGELSVRKHPTLGLWLMAYNCDVPRGINFRTANAPDGPWSDAQVIFDPGPDDPADHGYGTFIHAQVSTYGYDDGLSEIGREEEWGGEYGPYFIPSYFTDDAPGVHTLYYTLSSWNPYVVHLMRTVFVEPGVTAPPPANPGAGLPPTALRNGGFTSGFDGWTSEGDAFILFTGPDGLPRVTTFVNPLNDAVVGKLWQDFTVDGTTSEMDFTVHGGHASVELWHGTDLVRRTRGRDTNSPELSVRWRIAEYRGETLRFVIDDDQPVGPWGFIGCSGITFR